MRDLARLDGHRLAFDKRGADGSGKANLSPDPLGLVWGVVYEIAATGWTALDRFEGGYRRIEVEVERPTGDTLPAQTYVSDRLCSELPFAWYLDLVVAGARAHGLPSDWIRLLETFEARPGPSCEI